MMTFSTALGWTPQFSISKGGVDITSAFSDRVTYIKVVSVDGGGQGDKLEIDLDDRGWSIALPDTDGADATTLQVSLGYAQTGLYDQGTFEIGGVELRGPPKTLNISGSSNGFTSPLKSPIITSYDGKTLGEVISSIAASGGFDAVVDSTIGDQVIPYLHQHSSSMHLLQALERTYNGLAKFQDGTLSFTARGGDKSASGILLGSFDITPEDMATWLFKIIDRSGHSKVRASYWDKVQHQLVWLQNTIPSESKSSAPYMIKQAFNSKEEAQSAADSMMGALNRGRVRGEITLSKGDPSIHGGTPFTVSGTRTGMDGSYTVTNATHNYSKEQGIMTRLEFMTNEGSSSYSALMGDDNPDTGGIEVDQTNERPVTAGGA